MVVELTKNNFEETVKNASFIVVDFWASWCGPCVMFAPTFEKVSEQYDGKVTFAKVNTELEQELSAQFQIRSIPTLMVLRDQIMIYAQPGALQESQLKELLSKCEALDMDEVRAEIAKEQEANQA